MRLTSLLALIAIVGGIGYVAIFKRDWIFGKAREAVEYASGYSPAKTPGEALDLFKKAVKERKYKTAAKYVSGDYAEQLVKAGDAAASVGTLIDEINNYMENKGLKTDKAACILFCLDALPCYFKVKDAPKVEGEKSAVGYYEFEALPWMKTDLSSEQQQVDWKMMVQPLTFFRVPFAINPLGIPTLGGIATLQIVEEGKDGEKAWKLKIPLWPNQVGAVDTWLGNHKAYLTGLEKFRREMNNDRYASKRDFEREVFQVIQSAK